MVLFVGSAHFVFIWFQWILVYCFCDARNNNVVWIIEYTSYNQCAPMSMLCWLTCAFCWLYYCRFLKQLFFKRRFVIIVSLLDIGINLIFVVIPFILFFARIENIPHQKRMLIFLFNWWQNLTNSNKFFQFLNQTQCTE